MGLLLDCYTPTLSPERYPGEEGPCWGVVTHCSAGREGTAPGAWALFCLAWWDFSFRTMLFSLFAGSGNLWGHCAPILGGWKSEEQLGCCCHEMLRSLLSQKPAFLALLSAPQSPLALKEPFFSTRKAGEGGSPSSPPLTRRWGPGDSPLFVYLWEVNAKPLALPFPFLDILVSFFGLENFAN